MLPGKTYTPEEILRILLQRKWLILGPFILGLAASLVVASRVPQRFRSETLIMVIPQRVSSELVKPNDAMRIEDRLPTISQQIQTRSRLERIIADFDLYADARADGVVMEDIVLRMRGDIGVGLEGRSNEAFRISYESSDPHTAQKVAERLASWYIEENQRDKERFTESTQQFLDTELEDARQRLIAHEKMLEEYRRRYSGQLPSQLDTNLQTMQSLQMQLQAASDTMNRASERRLLFERQLADIENTAVPIAEAGANGPAATPLTAAQQLENARVELATLRQRYTADHPDVRAVERRIASLEGKAAAEARRTGQPETAVLSPAEALRQKRIKEYRAELEVIDRQVAAVQAEQARLQTQLSEYKAKIDAVPSRESELVELTRDYATLQATYTSLLGKRQESKLAANLSQRNIGEQFKVLDPASLPERPTNSRTRTMVVAAGTLGGLALGILLVGFLEYRDSSFRTEEDVIRVLSLPVLALVPTMISGEQAGARSRRGVMAALAAGLATVASLAALILWGLGF